MTRDVSLCAHLVCDGCLVAELRALETGDVFECVCGVRHEPRQRPSGVMDARSPVPTPRSPQTAPRRPLPRLVYVAPDGDAPTPAPTALERAGAAARALRPDDPELVRVRRLLADLRPDCGDPCEPPRNRCAPSCAATRFAGTLWRMAPDAELDGGPVDIPGGELDWARQQLRGGDPVRMALPDGRLAICTSLDDVMAAQRGKIPPDAVRLDRGAPR